MVTSVDLKFPHLPAGMEMSQIYCGGCRTLLMYSRGATSVRCSCCNTLNLVPGIICIQLRVARFIQLFRLIMNNVALHADFLIILHF
jgi:LSD1 subclass zinc finger protein